MNIVSHLAFTALEDGSVSVDHVNGVHCGCLYREVDGFYVYAQSSNTYGYIESVFLRAIADKLDELNAPWKAECDAALVKEQS